VLFFFQAEDGIRDYKVTGVQTCALPISRGGDFTLQTLEFRGVAFAGCLRARLPGRGNRGHVSLVGTPQGVEFRRGGCVIRGSLRSEERRVGKECRARRPSSQ